MAGLYLYRGNRLEALIDPLAECIARPADAGASLFQPDTVVVQGRGMVPFLQRELADRHGIAANVKFPYPNRLLRDLFTLVSPRPFPFDLHWLAWRIMTLLPGLLDQPEFTSIDRYIKKESATEDAGLADQRRFYRLSRSIADVFDQYIIHRPEMMRDWSRETPAPIAPEQTWQIALWRALFDGDRIGPDGLRCQSDPTRELNPIVLKERLIATTTAEAIRKILPARLFLFGIAALPALHREIFLYLSERIDLHVFALDPTPAGDARQLNPDAKALATENEKQIAIDGAIDGAGDEAGDAPFRDASNFADEIARDAKLRAPQITYAPLYSPPTRECTLNAVQANIFDGRARQLPADESISIHSCHSPLREVEVLYNYLLDLFSREPDLSPADVLIAAPNADIYAPLVQAVFAGDSHSSRRDASTAEASVINQAGATNQAGGPDTGDRRDSGEQQKLPVRILGWRPGAGAGLEALLRLWKLFSGRFRAEELLEILELPAVRDRLELSGTEVGSIRKLVERAGIRWGLDADHRASFDLPAMDEHTWRFGLDRLVLGYALSEEEAVVETATGLIAPVDALEGESALLFARFLEFVDECRRYAELLSADRDARGWAVLLRELCATFLADSARANLEQTLNRFSELAADPGLPGALNSRAIPGMLEDLHNENTFSRGGPGGEITFASMLPARQIPFAVICLVGMNQNDFPTKPIQSSFDLLEEKREYRRQEEIRLFLEQLLSARKEFFVSYVGRNIYNNRACQPSTLVSELMEHLDRAGAPRAYWYREHRLQPFHPAYFQDGPAELYSYVESHLSASKALIDERVEARGFFFQDDPRPEDVTPESDDLNGVTNTPGATANDANGGNTATLTETETTNITLDELESFYRNPAEAFLRRRLKLNPGEMARLIPDAEPFQLEPLDAYRLKRGLVDRLLEEDPDPALFEDHQSGPLFTRYYRKFRAAGLLPHGAPGEVIFRAHFAEACLFFADMQARVDTGRIQRRRFASAESGRFSVYLGAHDDVLLGGRLPADEDGLLLYRPALLKGRDLLSCWVRHLVLNLTGGESIRPETLFVARPTRDKKRAGAASSSSNGSVAVHRFAPLHPDDPGQRQERAREHLNKLLVLMEAGLERPLPFFPETSLAYYRVRADGGEETYALKEARNQWHVQRPGLEQGEFTNPAVQLCFAYREPVHADSGEHENFRSLSTEIYRPIFQYLSEDGGG